jgi:hypothetical protein
MEKQEETSQEPVSPGETIFGSKKQRKKKHPYDEGADNIKELIGMGDAVKK